MVNVADPVDLGLVASLGRPGGNITGFDALGFELNTKRLEVLKDAVPKLDRVGFLRSSSYNPGVELQLKELRVAAPALKLKLEEIKTQPDLKDLETAFKTAKQKQVKAIMLLPLASCQSFIRNRKLGWRRCLSQRLQACQRALISLQQLKQAKRQLIQCSRVVKMTALTALTRIGQLLLPAFMFQRPCRSCRMLLG